ncbi:MAG: glycosyltransferase family 39 protein [Proteobacteria bacterium]|nr:glycosyltransferase family 39 protein [Pseudomonadota bacterium]
MNNFFMSDYSYLLLLKSFVTIIKNSFLVFFIIALSVSLGSYLLEKLKFNFSSLLEKLVCSAGVGLGLYAHLVLLIGFLGWLYPEVFYAILLINFLLFYGNLKKLVLQLKEQNLLVSFRFSDWKQVLFFGGAAAIILFSFLANLTPVSFYDNLIYHYGVPKYYIASHRIIFIEGNIYANFPQIAEMLFLLGMILDSPLTANLIHFSMGIFLLLTVYSFSRNRWGNSAANFAILFLVMTPGLMQWISLPNVDIEFAWFNLLALFVLLKWFDCRSPKFLVLSAVFTGLSIGVKYTGIIYSLGIFILLMAIENIVTRRLSSLKLLKNISIYCGVGMMVFLPYLIKNYHFTGNPVSPALPQVFNPDGDQTREYQALLRDGKNVTFSKDFLHTIPQLVKIFLNNTVLVKKYIEFGSFIGLHFLIFLPLIFFLRRKWKEIRILIYFLILYAGFWIGTFWMIRFLYPALIVAFVLIGYAFDNLNKKPGYPRLLMQAVFILIFALNFFVFLEIFDRTRPIKYIFEGMDDKLYMSRVLPSYPVMEKANTELPPSAKILCLGETRNFYLDTQNICPSVFNANPLFKILKESNDVNEIKAGLKRLKITHILYDPDELERISKYAGIYFPLRDANEKTTLFDKFIMDCLPPVYLNNNVFLLEIKYS